MDFHQSEGDTTVVVAFQAAAAEASPRPRDREMEKLADRRGALRWTCNLEARCLTAPSRREEDWLPARIQNLSVCGLLLTGPRSEPNRLLAVELRAQNGSLTCLLMARVVHARPAPGGGWALGCRLTTHLSDRQLRALLL
jgi:hypothetical protein